MKAALQRVEDIVAFQLGRVRLEQMPPNRLSALARYGLGTKAPKLERTPEPKRTAMLTAVTRHLEAKAIDDALDLFEILMTTRLISAAKRSTDKQRLSTLPQLEKAARIAARVSKVVIEEGLLPKCWSRPLLRTATSMVATLAHGKFLVSRGGSATTLTSTALEVLA